MVSGAAPNYLCAAFGKRTQMFLTSLHRALVLLHYPNDAFGTTEPLHPNHVFQPLPIDSSLLGTLTLCWKAEMSSISRSAWNFAFRTSGIKFFPFNVCIGEEASFAFWGLMKDSGWGVCGSFVTRGMPPQLTVSNTLLVPVCSQNHPSLLSSVPFLLHLSSSLLYQLQECCSHRDYLPARSNTVFLQSRFCVFKEYMKKPCVAHRLTQRTIS